MFFIEWLYAPEDEFLEKRIRAIHAREKLVTSIQSKEWNYKEIKEILEYDTKIENYNIEQLAAKLLFDLTRNTGFEVSKKNIGACWITSCCDWLEKQENDVCGLDNNKMSLTNKMKMIYYGTSLYEQFFKIGLEISS